MQTQIQKPRLEPSPPEDIALSISGGGHRATLFGLGVLLALVDRGLNKRVKQIASVSGGSIVNAFIALHTRYNDPNLTPEVFNDVAAKLVKIIVHKGVLTRAIIVALLSALIVPPLLFIGFACGNLVSWYVAAPLVAAWLGLALLRGLVIEWLIEIRYFPPSFKFGLFPPKLIIVRKYLRDLHEHSLEHAICCTDLLEPGPVFFSSQSAGDNHSPGSFYSRIDNQTKWMQRCASSVPIAAAVRASAAFPGISPRLIAFNSSLGEVAGYQNVFGQSLFDPTPFLRKTTVLADGGIWNNLGTQVLRESNRNKIWHSDMALIIADASVPLASQRTFPYCIPVWALIRSILRISNIQHENTVEPRLGAMRERNWDKIINTLSIREEPRLNALVEVLGLSREQKDTFVALNKEGYLSPTEPWDIPVSLAVPPDVPLGIFQDLIMNVPSIKHKYGAVEHVYHGSELFRLARIDVSTFKTHLGRVQKNDAMGLLSRGYLSAFLWTVMLKPLETAEVSLLDKVPQRLNTMVTAA